MPNARVNKLREGKKGVDGKIDGNVLRWFGHVEKMENNRNAKRVYVGKCMGSC